MLIETQIINTKLETLTRRRDWYFKKFKKKGNVDFLGKAKRFYHRSCQKIKRLVKFKQKLLKTQNNSGIHGKLSRNPSFIVHCDK